MPASLPPRALKIILALVLVLVASFEIVANDGITPREILLGSHQPLTGLAAQFSDISQSTEIYFRYINDQGGVHGRTIRYYPVDDGFQPLRTREGVEHLVLHESVFLILNGLGTKTHAAVAPWLQALRIPDFFIGSSDPRWTTPLQKTTFGFQPTPQVEGEILAHYLRQIPEVQSVAVWYREASLMAQTAQYFSNVLQNHNIQVHPIAHAPAPRNRVADVEKIQQLAPDAVVLFTTPAPAIQFLKKAHEAKLSSNLFLGYDLADSRMLDWAGKDALEGVFFLIAHPLASQQDHPGIQLHLALLNEYAPDLEMNRWTIYGQAVAELMTEILHRAGRDVNRKNIIEAAEQLRQWQSPLNPPVTLTPENHLALTQLKIVQVQRGTFTPVSDWLELP